MQCKINIIDDEMHLNDLVRTYLEKEGHTVYSFYTFGEALNHVSDDVQLWLVDIMLDRGSGFDILNEIRKINPKVPVIFMSARDQDLDRIIGLEKGSDDYITKPFNIKEVVLRINNVLKRTYDESTTLVVDGYVIDIDRRKVFFQNKELELTTKEFDLLIYFVRNKGASISREQALNKVWDKNYYGSDRVVDDTLRRLRRKLPDLNIRTVYGYGYRHD